MANTGKIIAHFCGGAGTNISQEVVEPISNLGIGFCEVIFNYIDSSEANYKTLKAPKGELFLIQNKNYGAKTMHGSGGDRSLKAQQILSNIPDYLNSKKYLKKEPDEYHMVVFSGSGGTGSVAGPLLTRELIRRDIPVFCVVVGDSSNVVYAINTLNTLATLNKFAMDNNKPLSIIYCNNSNQVSAGLGAAKKEVNKQLFATLTAISLFLSGSNDDLDNQDIVNFIDQSNYKTIEFKPGLYGLHVYSKSIHLPDGATPVNARILTLPAQDYVLNCNLLHYKQGIVSNEKVHDFINKDQLPLFLVTYSNFFAIEEQTLRPQTENGYNIADSVVNNKVTGTSRSNEDEDTGLIL